MTVTPQSPQVLALTRGAVILSPRAGGLDILVREEDRNMPLYPSPCHADLRLPRWRYEDGVVVIALVINAAHKPLLSFQSWINAMNTQDNQILTALGSNGDIMLHIVAPHSTRAIKVPNVVRREANAIANDLRMAGGIWTREQFEAACRQLDVQFPTAAALYRSYAK